MATETAARKQAYNMNGIVKDLTSRTDRKGGTFATFRLEREGKKPQSCIAFGERAGFVLSHKKDGDALHVMGIYENRPYTDKDGATRTSFDMTVLFASEPRAPKAATVADAGPKASAAPVSTEQVSLEDDELPF